MRSTIFLHRKSIGLTCLSRALLLPFCFCFFSFFLFFSCFYFFFSYFIIQSFQVLYSTLRTSKKSIIQYKFLYFIYCHLFSLISFNSIELQFVNFKIKKGTHSSGVTLGSDPAFSFPSYVPNRIAFQITMVTTKLKWLQSLLSSLAVSPSRYIHLYSDS